jgi:hypothetical protein
LRGHLITNFPQSMRLLRNNINPPGPNYINCHWVIVLIRLVLRMRCTLSLSLVQLLHSLLMTRRIPVKLQLTGKSRLISKFVLKVEKRKLLRVCHHPDNAYICRHGNGELLRWRVSHEFIYLKWRNVITCCCIPKLWFWI